MTEQELSSLKQKCHITLIGHKQKSAAEELCELASFCKDHHIEHDTYGEGEFVQSFEHKIATLLGFEAGAFCVTGTMAQSIALRLATMAHGSDLVGMHASAHVLKHENSNNQLLNQFKTIQIGDHYRTWKHQDLQQIPDKLGAVLLELPMREIGGQLPPWNELQHIKHVCQEKHIHLHLDGARIWEAQPAYDRSLVEICGGANSIYVSFYKGIGGLAGSMFLGSREMVKLFKTWVHRQGGRTFRYTPYVISAASRFELRLGQMPQFFERTKQIAALFGQFGRLHLNPTTPQCNLFHYYLPVNAERAIEIRNHIAQQFGIWLFNRAANAPRLEQSYVEWYVGDNALNLSDEQIVSALKLLDHACSSHH